jgi:hypothetical protein
MALTSPQSGWCVQEFHKTNGVVTVQHAFRRRFNVDPPTNKSILKWHRNFIERGWCICDQRMGHSGITAAVNSITPDMLQRVWSELDYCIDVCRVIRGGTLSVCDTTWNSTSLCNYGHQFCKNIPVSFDFITAWNQGVFLCSTCIYIMLYFSVWLNHKQGCRHS